MVQLSAPLVIKLSLSDTLDVTNAKVTIQVSTCVAAGRVYMYMYMVMVCVCGWLLKGSIRVI